MLLVNAAAGVGGMAVVVVAVSLDGYFVAGDRCTIRGIASGHWNSGGVFRVGDSRCVDFQSGV